MTDSRTNAPQGEPLTVEERIASLVERADRLEGVLSRLVAAGVITAASVLYDDDVSDDNSVDLDLLTGMSEVELAKAVRDRNTYRMHLYAIAGIVELDVKPRSDN